MALYPSGTKFGPSPDLKDAPAMRNTAESCISQLETNHSRIVEMLETIEAKLSGKGQSDGKPNQTGLPPLLGRLWDLVLSGQEISARLESIAADLGCH